MTKNELQEIITDVVSFLKDIERVIPGKIDQELLSFLESILTHSWLVDLLLNTLTKETKKVTR